MFKQSLLYARYSLAFLWIFTAITSLGWGKSIGYDVLANIHLTDTLAEAVIIAGSLLDFCLGLWLLSGWRQKQCYATQIIVILLYTLLLTLIEPNFWLHPFGVLTKNLPILALLVILYQRAE